MNDVSRPPWSDEEVDNLNGFQFESYLHPFTCGNDACRSEHRMEHTTLRATNNGWVCGYCDYIQDWAFWSMVDGSWRQHAQWMNSWLGGSNVE